MFLFCLLKKKAVLSLRATKILIIFVLDANECARKPCKHEATCMNSIGVYSCICAKGFQGKLCDKGMILMWTFSCCYYYYLLLLLLLCVAGEIVMRVVLSWRRTFGGFSPLSRLRGQKTTAFVHAVTSAATLTR